ncbi:hypothetical protein GCM10009609_64480 [Pseudonocardia aurantiaca]
MLPHLGFRSTRFEGNGMDRIRATHTGSLPRPPALLAAIAECDRAGVPADSAAHGNLSR